MSTRQRGNDEDPSHIAPGSSHSTQSSSPNDRPQLNLQTLQSQVSQLSTLVLSLSQQQQTQQSQPTTAFGNTIPPQFTQPHHQYTQLQSTSVSTTPPKRSHAGRRRPGHERSKHRYYAVLNGKHGNDVYTSWALASKH